MKRARPKRRDDDAWLQLMMALVALANCACHTPLRPPAHTTPCGMRVFYAAGAQPIDPALIDRGEAFALRALDGIPFNEGNGRVDSKALCAQVRNWYLEIGRGRGSDADCQNNVSIGVYDWGIHLHELAHVATHCSGCQDQGPFGLSAGPINWHCPQWWPAAFDVAIEAARLEYQRATR